MSETVELIILLWAASGLLGYGLLVAGMLRWDRFDVSYLLVMLISPIGGPLVLIIAAWEWQRKV